MPGAHPAGERESLGSSEFAHMHLESHRRLSSVVLLLLLLPTLWFVRADFALATGEWGRLSARLVVRLAFVTALVLGAWGLSRIRTRQAYERLVLAVTLAIAVCMVLLNALRPPNAPLLLRSPLMTIFAIYGGLATPAAWQIGPPIGMTVALMVLRVFWLGGADTSSDAAGDLLVLAFANAIGVIIVMRRLALERSELRAWQDERAAYASMERAVGELHTLRGIIPICAGCRQVRTEIGEWQHLEAYVQEHSESQFSHGLCPECLARLYPEIVSEPEMPGR
jgi:hypothetical protein